MSVDVFISYHFNSSRSITEIICNCLEENSIRCWYAPRDVQKAYAKSISDAIRACKVFLLVLNKESSFSPDVLNEINLAFEKLRKGEDITILPFQIADEEISDDARYYIGRLHWIDAVTPPIEKRVKELMFRIKGLLNCNLEVGDEQSKKEVMHSSSLISNYNFIGRENEMRKLIQFLEKDRVVFLHGIGGNGKTELAKRYAYLHSKEYNTVIFASYMTSLKDLIISDKYFIIDGFKRNKKGEKWETDETFCERKLRRIKELSTTNTLIILDNFDVESDPWLQEFMNGPYKLIITTRVNYEHLGVPVIKINSLEIEEQLLLFKQFYKRPVKEEDEIIEIIKRLQGHTLAIELIAKLMYSKRIQPKQMLLKLREDGIAPTLAGNISHGFSNATTVYNYICQIFSMDCMSESERSIMMNLAILPISGIKVDDFIEWCEIEDAGIIDSLINRSWIIYNIAEDRIQLHPLIADVVRNEYQPDFSKCGLMIHNLDCKFKASWNMEKNERVEYGEIAKALYTHHGVLDRKQVVSLRMILCIFSNLDYIELVEKLLEEIIQIIGDKDSIELAWWYWDYGDFALRFQQYTEAIDNNLKAIEILRSVYPESYDLAYMLKHQAHIYHACYQHIKEEKDYLDKARIYLDESEDIFNRCLENPKLKWGSNYYSYALNLEKEHCSQKGSRYYAYALNYCLLEEYEKAEEYAVKSYEEFMKINGEVDPDTTAPMRVLAMIYSKTNRFDEAVNMERRVIEIRGKLWGTNQFRYFEQFETLADIYCEFGKVNEAIHELEHALLLIGDDNVKYRAYREKLENKIMAYMEKCKRSL